MLTEDNVTVSVVVPIYNVEKYLRKCIDSILGQTYSDIQVILVDDGSKDSSGQIIDEYAAKDNRVLAIHKENGGISSARNEGLKHVCGKYVTFVDSDDWLDLDMYETMVDAAEKYEADIVSSAPEFDHIEVCDHNILCKQLIRGDMGVWNKIFKASLLDKTHFSFDPNNISIDIKACFDLFAYCQRWVLVPKAFYNYRQDNISYGRSGFCEADLNAVKMTEIVSNQAKTISQEAYECAYNHVIHAKFDILNKPILFGYKSKKDREVYHRLKKEYIRDIRFHINKIIITKYFSRKEKLQMLVLSVSFPLFRILKKIYAKFIFRQCESIKC